MELLRRLRLALTPVAAAQLLLGWGAFMIMGMTRSFLSGPLATPVLFLALAVIVAVIVFSAFGVVAHAEGLAHRLGDPAGTLVLTLSIVVIEVILISAVMLGPGEHATIARDSVMAVSMIILNLVVGIALLVGGFRNGGMQANRAGVSAYLAVLLVLLTTGLMLAGAIGAGGTYRPAQAVPIIVLTVLLYGFFLVRQLGTQRADFREVRSPAVQSRARRGRLALAEHRAEIIARTVLLVLSVAPIVLLSHDMAALLDEALGAVGAPAALSGVVIALVVFLPETITTIRAAFRGELQRVSNLCHGALVSTVGLTIPAVLVIGLLTGQDVNLVESPVNLALLTVTLLLNAVTFLGKKATALHGGAHLMVFALYAMAIFA